uniref:histidine-containing phosphotransfer protein 1-like isoform X2 n=1 Tax=Erigeron canadensis TaxID=72917 RepID=UPI001CB947AE|nr:histidine-containing phosphotransfer protein 1-like isoform X2 [Erigeron canadensis]
MDVSQLERQCRDYARCLYDEGDIDEQFIQLQKLQDESNPSFVFEVISLFFEDTEKLLYNLTSALHQENVDYKQVDAHVHQLKGSSSSIGALKLKNLCIVFRNYCGEKNREGCLECLQQAKRECILIRSKLEVLFNIERQIIQAGGSVPMLLA